MKCQAVTTDRRRGDPHACPYNAQRDGLCGRHLRQREELAGQIRALESRLAHAKAALESLTRPAWPGNPS